MRYIYLLYLCIVSVKPQNDEIYYCNNCTIILGALASVHEGVEYNENGGKHVKCSQVIKEHSVARVEAMLFAVDEINKDRNLLKDVKLGIHIVDTCGIPSIGTNRSKQFIDIKCEDNLRTKEAYVAGVVGAMYSSVSIDVAKFLTPWNIPQISPASTSAKLEDKYGFPMFARTVPSDTYQNRVIVDILQDLNWTLISTIVSNEFTGEGLKKFKERAHERGICDFKDFELPVDHWTNKYLPGKDDKYFTKIMCQILLHTDSNVVVLLTNDQDTIKILKAKHQIQSDKVDCPELLNDDVSRSTVDVSERILRKLYWIATESVGNKRYVVDGYKTEALGGITLTIADEDSKFMEHWNEIRPKSKQSKRNIWFDKFWEQHYECNLKKIDCTAQPPMTNIFSKVHSTIEAVRAFAKALHNLQHTVCKNHGKSGVCPSMRYYKGVKFFNEYISKVNLLNSSGKLYQLFDTNGELAQPKYTVNQYQNINGKYGFQKIGHWFQERLDLDVSKLQWSSNFQSLNTSSSITPSSSCPRTCPVGYGLKLMSGSCCEGLCTPCEEYEYVDEKFQCRDCNEYCENNKCNGWWPSSDRKRCTEPKIGVYLPLSMVLSSSGVILTVICLVTFVKYKTTPVVRHSCFEHCIISMVGILILFLFPPMLEVCESQATCTIFRFVVPIGTSMMYSALLVKINRMYRIFYIKLNEKNMMKLKYVSIKPAYVDVKSQLIIITGMVGLSIFITIILVVYDIPDAVPIYPKRNNPELMGCNESASTVLISHFYSIFLIITCTYYAILTRKIPDNFKETQNIGFAMYSTCLLYMTCIAIFFSIRSGKYQVLMRGYGIAMSVSAFVVLACVFFPKVYIMLFLSEQNVRRIETVKDRLRATNIDSATAKNIASHSAAEDKRCSKCNTRVSAK